ncbi:MAG: hypothetical protein JNK85_29695 [Verrucomicrobiales bacterium]|nr:hypothetical protein [Verrucomicrobiales bacterium]
MNVPHALAALERNSAALGKALYSGGYSLRAIRLAGGFVIPQRAFDSLLVEDFDRHVPVPGACPVPIVAEADLSDATIPEGVGSFESLGVSELMVVKQRLLRYEMGEIAHIENVMATEERSREHRALRRTETLMREETETTRETQQDLETTERFELQSESEKTITEDSSRFAGITVSGSYGPSVDISANAGFTSAKSKASANSTATSHAREITERSVHRIRERVRRERSALTINEVEVINRHGFLNRDGEPEHIVGIYRWVDKIYEAQVFNYGKREIIEVVIPEPAALYRHLRTSAPREGTTLRKPLDPGYCTGARHTFEPLEPKHMNLVSAMFWASVYNVPGVTPPPPRFEIIGVALATKSDEDQPKEAQADNSLKVPHGYVAKRGVVCGNKLAFNIDGQNEPTGLEVRVGRHHMPASRLMALDNETDTVPIAVLAANTPAFAVTVEVECERTDTLYADWQLKTYHAIMTAYEEQRSAYETGLAEQALADEQQDIQGRNPTVNRQIERREIKRGAISQLTGQHFDDFDAMRKSVGRFGLPQADLRESDLEGRYVRFVEQAFEWENMQYLFYPYFWGRKSDWPLVSQLMDDDPLFEAFLQAGSCRVNVPIRPGFENAANAFLSTGVLPWAERGATVAGREPFLSIAEEMKSQQGAVYVKSDGTVSATQGEAEVKGQGTSFDDDDLRREITIGGDVYMIASIANEESLFLTEPYRGKSLAEGEYAIGAKAVGVPWTIRIPTSLVILQQSMQLPSFEAQPFAPPG